MYNGYTYTPTPTPTPPPSFTNISGGYVTPNGNVVLNTGGSGYVTPNGNVVVTNPK